MMARYLVTACLIYAAVVLQSTFAKGLAIQNIQPWFPGMALVACIALHEGSVSLFCAAFLGLMVDGLSGERMGPHTAIACCIATVLLMARQDLRSFGIVLSGIFVLCTTFAWKCLASIVVTLLERRAIDPGPVLISSASDGIYTALLMTSLLIIIQLVMRSLRRRPETSQPVLRNQWTMLTK